jgi:DNA primase small subunit
MVPETGSKLPREILFLKDTFRKYYSKDPVEPPFRFARREWGFFPFGGKMMFRHISFSRRSDIDQFFRDTAPMHSYYSVAYYQDPGLQPMGEKFKTWMGADLIFDLDADHLQNADEMTYEEQLREVKEEVKRLLFDFILDDLGLPREHTHLHFSGGRGYHVHVRAPDVLKLDSRSRRQIVDYITGRGLDFSKLFPKKTTDYNPRFRSYKEERDFRSRDEGGWITKIYEGKDRLLEKLMEFETKKDRVDYLLRISTRKKLDIKEKKCRSIIEDLFYKDDGRTARKMISKDSFTQTALPKRDDDFLALAASFSSIDLSGETDEPVTTDIKRLIRCPGSLHGKTGLKVVEVDMDSIDDFDPLRDAVALSPDPVRIKVLADEDQSLGGENFHLKEGETEVPLFLAYFLIARRLAVLP